MNALFCYARTTDHGLSVQCNRNRTHRGNHEGIGKDGHLVSWARGKRRHGSY